MVRFYGEELLTFRPTPKLEDHTFSAVRVGLFNVLAATLHIGGRSSIRNLRTRHVMVTGTHISRTKAVFAPEMFLAPSSGWKRKAACSFEMVVTQYQTTRPHVSSHRRENPYHLGLTVAA
jgi:hypothetical protein